MKKELWLRLQRYNFHHLVPTHLWDHVTCVFGDADASTRAFADKIARKLEWERRFALRAIAEYKKFVYLGVVSNFGVTPSKVIDQVWHEHLLFSRPYREFCSEILGCDFDHNPELVPVEDETGIFQAQYQETLNLYQREFNALPPADIWSVPKFKPDTVKPDGYKPRLKQKGETFEDTPLCDLIDCSDGGDVATGESISQHQHSSLSIFHGHADSTHSGAAGHSGDSGHSGGSGDSGHSGDSGSDGGSSSCSSGSSCSSSCGGGCGS